MTDSQSILALARAGAAGRAWAAFVSAESTDALDNPAALTLKGRLLKDQARKAQGEAQTHLYLQSAQAYADAAALHPDSYPLINAATMSLFAGQPAQTALLAQQVLALLETGEGVGETPYWHEATRAEALLLLGRRAEAEAALGEGLVTAPNAWEDHATTLRQFRGIHRHRGEPVDWLAAYAPPPSIYFKGIMGIAPDDRAAAEAIAAQLDASGARFAYGALAAGADILLAEAMLRAGGELHLVLPVMPSAFKAQSVAPYGAEWAKRFDVLFEQAASVEIVDPGDRLSLAAIALSTAVAKGRATDNAARLESQAIAFEIVEAPFASPGAENPLIVAVERSAGPADRSSLPARHIVHWIATDATDLPAGLAWQQAGAIHVGRLQDSEQAVRTMSQLRTTNADAAVALHVAVADDDAPDDHQAARLERLVQTAVAGTTIATAAAAMLVKAAHPSAWVEPLGELADPNGATSVYAVGDLMER